MYRTNQSHEYVTGLTGQVHTHTHTRLTALFVQYYPGEPVPEK